MNEGINWDLLGKYVAGECSPREAATVQAWLAADGSRRDLVEELQQIWEATGAMPLAVDVDAAWQRVHSQMHPPGRPRPLRRSRPARRSRTAGYYLLRIAAVFVGLAVPVLLLMTWTRSEAPPVAEVPPREVVTQHGQRATVRLQDGTEVRLNVASRLTYPETFGETAREVTLEGEAYFDVAPDEAHPFVIRTGGARVDVVGTAFDVRAYPEEARVEVAVTEGLVVLRPDAGAARDTVQLRPQQLGVVAGSTVQALRRVDLGPYLAWTEGRLVFQDAPFPEVVSQLERWYDLQIQVAVPRDDIVAFNGTFEDEPLSEILNLIAAALDLKYERDRRTITFFR